MTLTRQARDHKILINGSPLVQDGWSMIEQKYQFGLYDYFLCAQEIMLGRIYYLLCKCKYIELHAIG